MVMARRILLAFAFFAILALTLAGCGKEPAPAPAPPPTAKAPTAPAAPAATPAAKPEALTTADLDKVGKAAKPYKLALVVKTRNNPFFTPMIKAAEDEAKALGVTIEVQAPPQEDDKEKQFALVQDVVAKGVDALLIAPADSKGIVPALKQAQDKGVKVINIDNRVDADAARAAGLSPFSYVGADNEEGGALAGKALVEALGGKGKIVILEGIRGADNAESRRKGCERAVQPMLDIVGRESAEWDTQKAYNKMQSLLAAHPDLDGAFCANDKMALGAAKAVAEADKKGKIKIVGYDNIDEVKPLLADGQMSATIEQHPDLMGKYAVLTAVGLLDGSAPAGRETLVGLEVIHSQ
jgi:ribose transport system substrate-binding protein